MSQYATNEAGNESGFGPRAARLALAVLLACAGNAGSRVGWSDEGYELLRSKAYLPADFDQDVFDALWTTWPEPLRSNAEQAPVEERRRMAMDRYGLDPDPADPSRSLQYVRGPDGAWTMSCLACHQGQVAGRVIPGVPNSNYALETLTEEVRLVKVKQRKPFGHMDMGSLLLPLGTTNGTTNAVIFGVALMRHRDAELNIIQRPPRFDLVHHDMDAPAWWHYRRRTGLYADGFAPKGHRMLMQFLLVKENGPEAWPGAVDDDRVARGAVVYADHCAGCHGAAGDRGPLVERVVPLDDVGTDPVRLASLSAADRAALNASWFGHHGADGEAADLGSREAGAGYVAPPLDGVWASAPYFHNGSVPTLWHVLHPESRPAVWRRTRAGYDQALGGLEIATAEAVPAKLPNAERRGWFDTAKPGKSAAGHDFPAALDEAEKRAVLEYLKTL